MDIEKLRVLLSVVESGSIQGASRSLGLPRSQLRRRIEGLEAEVGVPLLHRDADGVRLTAAGCVVAERGRSILQGTESLLSDARAAAGEATGVLRVFEPIGLPLSARTRCLLAMRGALPRLQFVVRQVEDPIAHLDEPCDLALHDGPMPDRSAWFSRVVARVPLCALASPGYLASRGSPDGVAALSRHEVLGWKRARERADAWPLRGGGEVVVSPWFISHDLVLLRALAAEGGGILFAPQTSLLDDPTAGPLVGVLEDEVGAEMLFRVSTRHHSNADTRTREALEHILRVLADFPEE
ncbi:MAG: LysR family transcriptional regulator [Deltaproteobacteria bacterium]|nr:LysR family transcriptional regulator [Deltaproteobacteria bacterium]